MFHLFLNIAPYLRILKYLDLNRDLELCREISNQNLIQWLKSCERSYTKESVNNQKVQECVLVLIIWEHERDQCFKSLCKIFRRQNMQNQTTQNISVILRSLLNQLKTS